MGWLQNERVRWALTAVAIGGIVVGLLMWTQQAQPQSEATLLLTHADQSASVQTPASNMPLTPDVAPTPSTLPMIAVDVIGAVQQPGVYYLPESARVDDAVAAAGGLAPDADRDSMNMAAHVVDGTQIRAPRVGEAAPQKIEEPADQSEATSGLININTADAAALDSLPGIGPATADAIVEYRAENGPFKRVEDIDGVKGIGPALLAEITPRVTVSP